MILSGYLSLREIALAFNTYFPSLRVVFYYAKPAEGRQRLATVEDQDQELAAIGHCSQQATLEIDGQVKISEFEKLFLQTFGVGIRVTRQRGFQEVIPERNTDDPEKNTRQSDNQ